ncbi:MAG TPA: adenylate/guanylate cyclase domain-containing protein [Gaiellaceae bacterium]|nr:adenylate/guanylate cyclase domain-containing protein [Gaiellaceae bacterium]
MATCPDCGAGIPDGARFCATCGAAVTAAGPDRRKIVTVLFSDLTGSTQLAERHDAETVRRVLRRYFDEFSNVLVRHGGTVEKFVGDAVLAVFGIPAAHEDDAFRAVRAAIEMRATLDRLNDELEPLYGVRLANHTGINTGEVVTGDPSAQTLVTGDAVNVAARLEQAASAAEILLGDSTHELVRGAVETEPLPPLELKGKSEPVPAWRLAALRPDARLRPLDTPLVGRDGELAVLRAELERAELEQACRRVNLIGAAGIGKSRLALELGRHAAQGVRVLQARCLSYGDGITFWPLAEIVRTAASIGDDVDREEALRRLTALVAAEPDGELVAARVAVTMGLADRAAPAEETAWAARRLFETLAREGPLVLVFDDVHWAEPALLDLLDYVTTTSQAAILLLTAARPDLLERRPELPGTTVLLEPLRAMEAEALIDLLAGEAPLPERVRTRVRILAAGNPLFVEETLAMLRDRPDENAIPPTIQALLAARLDALPARELDLLVRASVVGQEISRAALLELVDDDTELDESVSKLACKDLLRTVRSTYADEAYRFRHVLVRDAAYAASLKEVRADLHERFARWLARTTGERVREYEEIVGYHFEQAHRLRIEIAPGDPVAARLAADGARALGAAGRRAVARGDSHAASDLLTRAAGLEPDPLGRADLLTHLAEARLYTGDLVGARALAEEARATAAGRNRRVELRAAIRLAQLMMFTDPSADHARIGADAEAAAAELEQLGDLWSAADARMLLIYPSMTESYTALSRTAETARLLARRAGNGRVEAEATTWQGVGAVTGPMPVPEAIAYCERLREESSGPLAEAHAVHPAVWLYGLAGRIEDAREAGAYAAEIFRNLGLTYWVHGVALPRAWVERLIDERAREEKFLRDAVEFLQTVGDTTFLSTYAAELALTLAETGRPDKALEWVEISRTNTADADLDSQIGWRVARATALNVQGELDEAEQLTREAVGLAFLRDSPLNRGQTLVLHAEVLQGAGKSDEARATAEQALEQMRRKGSDLALEQARRRIQDIRIELPSPA